MGLGSTAVIFYACYVPSPPPSPYRKTLPKLGTLLGHIEQCVQEAAISSIPYAQEAATPSTQRLLCKTGRCFLDIQHYQ